MRAAWIAGCKLHAPQYPPLERALEQLACEAAIHGVPVSGVLRTLDAVCRSDAGGDPSLDWDHAREWAGGVVIRAYYRTA